MEVSTAISELFSVAQSSTSSDQFVEQNAGFLLLWSVFWGVVTAMVASGRGRSAVGWFVLGFFFTFIPLIVVLLLPRRRKYERKLAATPIGSWVCPRCKEWVRAPALTCSRCGLRVSGT